MRDFLFKTPTKVHFGVGASEKIGDLCEQYHAKKILIVTDTIISKLPAFEKITDSLKKKGLPFEIYWDTSPEPPVEDIDKIADYLKQSGADLLVAVGGGSPIDTAKAVSMLAANEGSIRDYLFGGTKTVQNPSLPLICIPTTAGSGSEVTAASVITDNENNIKLSVTHEYIIPKAAIIDPLMQMGMPLIITASTGMDALTHAIEAYMSLNASPFSDSYSETAMKLIGENLYTATFNPNNIEARSHMGMASVMAATAFANAGLGAVHGISQAMGGIAHVPHGIANAMMLPFVMEKNAVGNTKKAAKIAELLGENGADLSLRKQAGKCPEVLSDFAKDLRIPRRLRDVKVTKEMFPAIVKGTMEYRLMAVNPVKLTESDIYEILEKAY